MGFADKAKAKTRVRVTVEAAVPPTARTRVRVEKRMPEQTSFQFPAMEESAATLAFNGRTYVVHPDVARYVDDLFQLTFSISTRLHEKHHFADAMMTMDAPKIDLGMPRPKRVRV